jgi:hypothetical protein
LRLISNLRLVPPKKWAVSWRERLRLSLTECADILVIEFDLVRRGRDAV